MTTAPTLAITTTSAMNMPMASSSTTTTSAASMPGMDTRGSGHCQTSMFWNWYTLDACFLSTTWHISSRGMFAGSCIGVIGLVVLLEFLRRLQREYDRHIQLVRTRDRKAGLAFRRSKTSGSDASRDHAGTAALEDPPHSAVPLLREWEGLAAPLGGPGLVPTVLQQGVRAGIYVLQFAVAYIIMLLAMYYNGYIIICIFIGAFVGFFIFSWDASGAASVASSENAACCA
ncbi:Ctr copper transporter family-domain-containing protein [Usnea florida]